MIETGWSQQEPDWGYRYVEFVGGPLDGPNQVHPMSNYIQWVDGYPTMQYRLREDGKYYWEPRS